MKKSASSATTISGAEDAIIKTIRKNFNNLSDDAIREITQKVSAELQGKSITELNTFFYKKLSKEILGDNISSGIFAIAFKEAKERIVKESKLTC